MLVKHEYLCPLPEPLQNGLERPSPSAAGKTAFSLPAPSMTADDPCFTVYGVVAHFLEIQLLCPVEAFPQPTIGGGPLLLALAVCTRGSPLGLKNLVGSPRTRWTTSSMTRCLWNLVCTTRTACLSRCRLQEMSNEHVKRSTQHGVKKRKD